MSRQAVMIGAFAAVLGVAGATQAKPRHMDFPISIESAETRGAEAFDAADADGNGEITVEEFEAAELSRYHRGPGRHRGGPHKPGHDFFMAGELDDQARAELRAALEAELFRALDTDGDGKLSADEFSLERQRDIRRLLMKQRAFAHMDTDGDGVLSRDEFPRHVAHLKRLDTNQDGEVSRDELRAGMHARFHQSG